MYVKSILWILLFVFIQEESLQESDYDYGDETYEDLQLLNCSVTESITGGHVTYSQGGLEGSVMTYHCGPGQYPFPVSSRICDADGEWSTMRLASGRPVSIAKCKNVLCPAQLQLDHGDFWPRDQWFPAGTTQSFSCQEGFTLSGSAERNCTDSGEWTGETPVCDSHADDCDDPGVPPGAQRSAGRFHMGEKVTYRCQAGLDLLGSDERVCLEDREWSGSAPRCQGPNTFDSPSRVAAAMGGSLAGLMDVISPDSKKKNVGRSFGRTFRVIEGSRMNIYILLDTSGSIRKEDFEKSRDATIALIRKLDSYEVQMNFHVLSFASEARDIVNISDTEISSNAEEVIWYLTEFDYNSHGRKTGTNLYSALYRVGGEISFLKTNSATNHFNETQNIIIIETDGHSNTGGKPQIGLARIRHLLGYNATAQDHTHETMLGDQSVTMCGVAQEDASRGPTAYTRPWHVALKSPEWKPDKSCYGSIVSSKWVLTAAHCFARESTGRVPTQLDIDYGGGTVQTKKIIMHPKYNTNRLKHRNVSEFYDYDVALIQVNNSIPLSWKARPICLPCTVPASRAMRKINSTCEEHRKELLAHKATPANFIHKKSRSQSERKDTHIHTDNQRPGCVENARRILKQPTDVTLDEFVPDTFLCTGGTIGYKDAIACKGDSGGSLFLQKRKRYFQVGVVSWGIIDVCASRGHSSNRPPPEARDFHIDLFKIMPWLKQHLGAEIQFLSDIK
uniref:C3/C5 convertase n=1 Tax=Acanthochromis polyacanthus TaxID=80966 RepID=A0A3Q1HLQ1_9TELE